MNCLACRRQLLAAPRERTPDQQAHLERCEPCTRLASDLAHFDRRVSRAVRLPIPDGLADRILLPRRLAGRRHYAAAAAALIAAIAVGVMSVGILEPDEPTVAAETVGPAHPAVAAISMVIEQEPSLLKEGRTGDPRMMQETLKRLGLELKQSEDVPVRYIGKCRIAGNDCDHLVLVTPEGHVSVILMTGGPSSGRVLVADRRMAALLSPLPSGAYIVVAESPKAVKKARKLIVHG